ncbi:MAG: hypothetical protein HKL88_02380, partial [Bacteroidia bacterium]|nr:hypothetical protein [Bacteroidia bacterium]
MKPFNYLQVSLAVLLFTPCFAQDNAGGNNDDGIYSTPSATANTNAGTHSDAAPAPEHSGLNQQNNNSGVSPMDSGSNQLQGSNDYYDNNYDYTSQLRRYDDNWGDWNYYDDIYTNSYWYSGDPYQYGMSIYMGSPCWGPSYYGYSYDPSMYWGLGCGWGLGYGWGYPGWGWGGYGLGCGWGWG